MSTTFRINSVGIFDPARITWAQIETLCDDGIGQKSQSLMRSVVLDFPTMTASQYNDWVSKCDNNTAYNVYLPERLDAAYATNPETVSGAALDINGYTQQYAMKYALHFMGADYSYGQEAYNTKVLLYTYMEQHTIRIG